MSGSEHKSRFFHRPAVLGCLHICLILITLTLKQHIRQVYNER